MSVTIVVDKIKKATSKAILVVYENEEIWLPVSQLELDECDDLEEGAQDVSLTISDWIASEKGLD